MKKLLLSVILIAVIMMTGACAVKKIDTSQSTKKVQPKVITAWDEILEKNEIVIGVDGSSFNNNLVEALKTEMNINTVTSVFNSFDEASESLKNKEIDMYIGMFPKESALSIDYALSEPYLQSTTNVIAKSQDYKINRETDKAGVLKGSAEERTASLLFNEYILYNSVGQLFNALINGKVNCILLDEVIYGNSGYDNGGYFVCDSYPYNLVAIFNEKDSEITKEMNIYLAKIKASGIAGEISREYFGKDIIYK